MNIYTKRNCKIFCLTFCSYRDNCGKELKNKYALALAAALVYFGWCKEVIFGTMMVGHTHTDIDQMFSTYAQEFKESKAFHSPVSFIDNISSIYKSENTRPLVSFMTRIFDWKKLFETTIPSFKNISQYHGFKITMHEGKPALQVRNFNFKSEDWVGPENNSETYFTIFEDLNIGIPDLCEIPDLPDDTLTNISSMYYLFEPATTEWYKQLITTKGKCILINETPSDFWLQNQNVPPSSQINDSQDILEEEITRPKTLTPTKPSKHLYEEPTRNFISKLQSNCLVLYLKDTNSNEYFVGEYLLTKWGSLCVSQFSEENGFYKNKTVKNQLLWVKQTDVLLYNFTLTGKHCLDKRISTKVKEICKKRKKEQEEELEMTSKPKKKKKK